MDIDRLTEVITEEVRKYLAESGPSAPACACPSPAVSGGTVQDGGNRVSPPLSVGDPFVQRPVPAVMQKVLCLIHGEMEEEREFFVALGRWTQDGISVESFIGHSVDRKALEKRGVRVITALSELGTRNEKIKSYRAVILPSLDRTLAAKVALGIADEDLIEIVFSALFYRVPVLAARERLLLDSQTTHGNNLPGMANKIAGYRADLERMGIAVVPMKEMLSRVVHSAKIAIPNSGEVIGHLITADDAKNLPGPVIRVERGGLVTPTARELLAARGIEIEIVGEGTELRIKN